MISAIKKYTKCKMFVGQNGRIWIHGSTNEIILATRVIKKIEREAHRVGLTEAIQQFLIQQRTIIDQEPILDDHYYLDKGLGDGNGEEGMNRY